MIMRCLFSAIGTYLSGNVGQYIVASCSVNSCFRSTFLRTLFVSLSPFSSTFLPLLAFLITSYSLHSTFTLVIFMPPFNTVLPLSIFALICPIAWFTKRSKVVVSQLAIAKFRYWYALAALWTKLQSLRPQLCIAFPYFFFGWHIILLKTNHSLSRCRLLLKQSAPKEWRKNYYENINRLLQQEQYIMNKGECQA